MPNTYDPRRTGVLSNSWIDRKFPGNERVRKVRCTLLLAGVSCTLIGTFWAICYFYLDRIELAFLYAMLILVGIGSLACTRRSMPIALIGIAHSMLLLVVIKSMIDVPLDGIPRSIHLYFLPLGAAAFFVFRTESRYMSLVFPGLCVLSFVLFGARLVEFDMAAYAAPVDWRFGSSVANHVMSTLLLMGVLFIHREDVNAKISQARDLARAIARGEMLALYQPQVDATGRLIGAEALVRWQHPERGLLTPNHFIPLAEESLLIRDLGVDVLRQACELLRTWDKDPVLGHVIISVNVSPVQLLDPDFPATVRSVLKATGADPAHLELELTESALSIDLDLARANMWALRSVGVRWALDDFGSGFSSLSLLRSLPVQKIKIDRQFVADAAENESGRQLLAKIIEISEVLGMSAIAEGIENESQHALLASIGCREFQGYHFGRPQLPDALALRAREHADRANNKPS